MVVGNGGKMGFVGGNGVAVGKPLRKPVVSPVGVKASRVARVVMNAENQPEWWKGVQTAAFSVAVGMGFALFPKSATAKNIMPANVQVKEEKSTDVGTLFAVGGVVLGALALKKKLDENRANTEVEKRMKEQQESFQEGKAPTLDLRDLERKQKVDEEMEKFDADKEAVDDAQLMSDLRKRMEKLQGQKEEGDGEDDNVDNKPGADGRRDHTSRGNTGSATLEPPSGEPRMRPRRPIQRQPRNSGQQPRRSQDDAQGKGGTIPPPSEEAGEAPASQESLDMLKRMWDLSAEDEQGSSGKK